MSFTYKYPHPAVTVDCVIFGLPKAASALEVLLIKRKGPPFKGKWAIPGGFVNMNESLEAAARRELKEETSLTDVFLEQLYTFGAPKRDPRERVITVTYYALVNQADFGIAAGSDAANARWFLVDELPRLAFDHEKILNIAIWRLRNKVRYEPIGFTLLPLKFTMADIQQVYEAILGRELDKRNFRRRIHDMDILTENGTRQGNVGPRAQLYKLNERRYRALVKNGFNFEV